MSAHAPLFYGWRIAGAGFGMQFLVSALLMQAFGAYVAVLSEELGWSKTALAGGAAIQSLEGAVIGPLLGWLIDRLGARIVVRTGVVIFALGFAVLSRIDTMAGFYVALVLIAVGTSMSGYFPLSVALMHWFERRRARALSIMAMGLAAGGLAVPLVAWSIQEFGWRGTAMLSALIVLGAGWPLASIVRGDPREMGETPDGDPEVQPHTTDGPAPDKPGFTAVEALRTPAFWLLGFGHGLALLVVTAVNVHAISHMKQGLGYTLAEASFFITLMTLAQGGGVVLGGIIGDRWDKQRISAACMVAHMAGLLMLTFAAGSAMLVAFALLHGTAWGLRGPFMQALRAEFFGLRAIGMILGLSAVLIALGQIAGPLVAGAMADAMGHYRTGFVLLALAAGAGSVMFLFARKPQLTSRAEMV